jgi:tetratricopeptide (TPR) repeat protein
MDENVQEAVPPKVRDLYNKGFVAMERGNLDYAITLFARCVDMEPRFLSARKFLRAAEIKQFKAVKPNLISTLIGSASALPYLIKANAQIKSGKPSDALQTLESLFRKNPLNPSAIQLFANAAEAASLPELAIQALSIATDHDPKNTDLLTRLGELYMRNKQPRAARECFEVVCQVLPNDGPALKRLKDAMAISSIEGGLEDAIKKGREGYRDQIRDKKQATLLEKESKAVRGTGDFESLEAEYLERIKKEPENINYQRALANLYSSNGHFEKAIAILEDAQKLTAGRDPMVDNAISTARMAMFNRDIEQLRMAGDAAGAARLSEERDIFSFQDLQDRVKRYPNDLQIRFEFGALLYARGQINEAIQQFQMSQRGPQYRARSMYFIGLCFAGKKQYDMAAQQLEKANADMSDMDENKKACLYELGQIYEATNNRPKALDYYKEIYQVDISYRDVSAKIEHGYGTGPSDAP